MKPKTYNPVIVQAARDFTAEDTTFQVEPLKPGDSKYAMEKDHLVMIPDTGEVIQILEVLDRGQQWIVKRAWGSQGPFPITKGAELLGLGIAIQEDIDKELAELNKTPRITVRPAAPEAVRLIERDLCMCGHQGHQHRNYGCLTYECLVGSCDCHGMILDMRPEKTKAK